MVCQLSEENCELVVSAVDTDQFELENGLAENQWCDRTEVDVVHIEVSE